jgi:predicted transglutaminase-like cysteine proteinase
MRKILGLVAASAALLTVGINNPAKAGMIGSPQALRGVIQYIKFEQPTLPPMSFTQFCLKFSAECKPRKMVFRGGRSKLTGERWAELNAVNREVNAGIRPEANTGGLAEEKWLIHPASGDCNDYAVTKRHDLLAKGWPARNVLLSEVVTTWGEHHLVVVVRTNAGDLVLDNLSGSVVPWQRKPYQWVRIQMPKNPNYWASLANRNA